MPVIIVQVPTSTMETKMRSNSGNGKSSNNTGDPTLKEHERAKGVSGNAIQGEQKSKGSDRLRSDSRNSGGPD